MKNTVASGRLRSAAVALASLAFLACGRDPRDSTYGSSGSGEVPVVENTAARWAQGQGWSVADTPSLVIGSEDQEGYEFSMIAGAVRLSDGRIAVGDGGSGQVRLFGPRGELLRVWGRSGAGPEEFRAMSRLVALRGDSLAVFDEGNNRVSVIAPDGSFARLVTLRGIGPGAQMAGALDEGSFVFGLPRLSRPAEGVTRDTIVYVRVARDGTIADTIAVAPGGQQFQSVSGGRITRITVPFGPFPAAAASGSQIFLGATDEYTIRQFHPRRGALRIIRRRVPPRPFTDAEYDRFLEEFAQFGAVVQQIPRPKHLPLYASIAVDREGNLWVQDRPAAGAPRADWSVFGRDGVMLGAVSLPTAFRATDIGQDYVLGVQMDDEGTETVRLYPLRKP